MGHISFGDALDWDGTHYPNPSSAIDGAINMVSTSRYTAKTDPVELTETTDRVRYRFLATNVDNPKDPSHCVEGKFVYERKRKGDASFPSDSAETELGPVSRGMLQRKGFNGDWLELTLDTGETRRLYEALDARYRIQQESGGVQGGSTTYVPLDRSVSSLLKMMRENPSETRLLAGGNNFELVKEMIRLMTQGTTREQLSEIFSELEKGHLDDFTVSLSLAQLEKAEKEMPRTSVTATRSTGREYSPTTNGYCRRYSPPHAHFSKARRMSEARRSIIPVAISAISSTRMS